MRGRGGRKPSTQEQALWDRVAAKVTPLPNTPKRAAAKAKTLLQPTAPAAPKPAPRAELPEDFAIGSRGHLKNRTASLPAAPAAPNLDRKLQRNLQRGKLKPEARIDLHGLTLADAQPALQGFILQNHAAGRRLVLVITGKGRGQYDDDPVPRRPGLLRRQVPIWLRQGPMAAIVQDVTEAHQRHGGSGAYYVYLRRQRK
ncbi:Smr/MutS family protein [Ovoidimarina sediminis]|uniref:Smr/MutS family protein n=1 Tax=Ovoidimarina sediminis TaxID=3079856 RepID=UPI00290BFDB0|nr:Smr/MutS family protein [Rhodophyticola sp. MJ-SS7]MDU8942525.1 Smr/MutS family protein [Rhodophyticola sp. MJ-SS7]